MRGGWVGWTLLVALVLAYPAHCLLYPQRDCRCCKGKGVHRPEPESPVSRRCWWCKATGKRARYGTRLWRRVRRARAAK